MSGLRTRVQWSFGGLCLIRFLICGLRVRVTRGPSDCHCDYEPFLGQVLAAPFGYARVGDLWFRTDGDPKANHSAAAK